MMHQTPLVQPKTKLDIPVPQIDTVKTYGRDVPANYILPRSYVRYHRMSQKEMNDVLEYVADEEDENWLDSNTKFGGAVPDCIKTDDNDDVKLPAVDPLFRRAQLSLGMFEHMMDILEKATAFESIVTIHQAENLFVSKIPALAQIFPLPSRGRQQQQYSVNLKQVINDVYNYWVQKRSKLKRPLLRRFWPVTSTDDTNPHFVFRPREKEKYKLRKKRQNDLDAYQKLKQLRLDFDNLRALADLVKRRQELDRARVHLQVDLFEQRLYEIVDTTGRPRLSNSSRNDVDRVLDAPMYFDTQGRKVKRLRSADATTTTTTTANVDSGSPVLAVRPTSIKGIVASSNDNHVMSTSSAPIVNAQNIAGHNNGEPAPHFLQPLRTRESYVTSWDGTNPYVATYVDSHAVPTYHYRQRARIGRGGRLCVDRIPVPVDLSTPTFFTAGRGMMQSVATKERLLDLLPNLLNYTAVSRRIEELSIAAVKEDLEGRAINAGDPDETDDDQVIVKVKDWLETDEQLWGEEHYALGPL
jgi:enhancer of polycomb-like protein